MIFRSPAAAPREILSGAGAEQDEHCHLRGHGSGAGRGSAEDDANAMCRPLVDEPDAEIAGQGNAVDLD